MIPLLDPAVLIKRVVRLITGYNPTVDTIDVHIERALGPQPAPGESHNGLGMEDWLFLQQTFYGTERMAKALRIFLNALYHVKSTVLLRQDVESFKVIAYLLFFRLREMGNRLLPLLEALDTASMHHLLSFALDNDAMRHWVMDGWCGFLDRGFIENSVLAVLEDHRPMLEAWLARTQAKAFGAEGGAAALSTAVGSARSTGAGETGVGSPGWRPTIPRAPKLTQPRGRLPPEPVRIQQYIKANPMPQHLDAPGRSLEDLQSEREARRRAVAEQTASKYVDASAPALHETRRTVDRIRAEVEAAREAELQKPADLGYRPPPPLPSHGADVAYTVAAILREDAIARSKAEAEAALLREFEGNLRDSRDFYAWQEGEKRKDEEARLAAVAARKAEAEAAAAKLQGALQMTRQGKRLVAQSVRRAAVVAEEHLKLEREIEAELHAKVAAQVREKEYIAPTLAKTAVVAEKRVVVRAVRERRVDDEAAIAVQKAQEQEQKVEILRQIRALERVPRPHVKVFDPTALPESAAYTLESMTMVELHERLVLLKARQAQEEEDRRRDILRGKREQQEMLMAKVQAMKARRAASHSAARAARAEREEKKAVEAETLLSAREEGLLRLSMKLEAKKQARALEMATLRAEQERAEKEAAFRGTSIAVQEEERLRQVLLAQERMVAATQAQRVQAAAVEQRAAARRELSRQLKSERDRESAALLGLTRSAALADARAEEHAHRLAETAARKDAFFRQTVEETAVRDARDALNVYGAEARKGEVSKARAARGAPSVDRERELTLSRRLDRLPPGHPLSPNMTLKLHQARAAMGGAER